VYISIFWRAYLHLQMSSSALVLLVFDNPTSTRHKSMNSYQLKTHYINMSNMTRFIQEGWNIIEIR